jgi:hypothetical protein
MGQTIDKETALSVYVSAKLTRNQYNIIRNITKCQFRTLLSYYEIRKAKEECLPERQSVTITDAGVQVCLQSLLNHTAIRFIKLLRSDLEPFMNLTIETGCDGASNQSSYKLIFDDKSKNDSSVLYATLYRLKYLTMTTTKFCDRIIILLRLAFVDQ